MKRIKSENDLTVWHQSPAFFKLQNFLEKLFESLKSRKLSEIPTKVSNENCRVLSSLLEKVSVAVEEIKPVAEEGGRQRYGNKSFRILINQINEISMKDLPNDFLQKLFSASFGDSTRIDYGTGHELSFIIFVMCYMESSSNNIGLEEYSWIGGNLIGQRYLKLCRRIQERYSLEPAGSHGVWGLDDHQFIPFLLGSSQLIGKEEEFDGNLSPSALIQPKIFSIEEIRNEYLYAAALFHIHQLKTRSNSSLKFHHHSPLLYDISGVPTWQKIHEGLKRMYLKEVLSKFPVVQHLLFDDELFEYEMTENN